MEPIDHAFADNPQHDWMFFVADRSRNGISSSYPSIAELLPTTLTNVVFELVGDNPIATDRFSTL